MNDDEAKELALRVFKSHLRFHLIKWGLIFLITYILRKVAEQMEEN